jgi:hypothetical protein
MIDGKLGEAPEETRLVIARLLHETAHLRHHLCTSFGYIYHVLNTLLTRSFVSGMATEKLPFDFPIWTIPRPEEPDERTFSFMEYNILLDLQQCFDGSRPVAPDAPPAGLILLDMFLRQAAGRPLEKEDKHWFIMQFRHDNTELVPFLSRTAPYVPQLFGSLFGGRHLLEALAFTREISFAMLSGAHDPRWSDMSGEAEYGIVLEFWNRLFVEGAVLLKSREATKPEPLERGFEKYWPLELIAAIDVALSIPIGPSGLFEHTRPLTWHDIHPGWRFIQICLHLKRTGARWHKIPEDPSGTDILLCEIERSICDSLGWPHLSDLYMDWLEFLGKVTKEGARGLFVEFRDHARLIGSLALCARRLAQPYSIMLGYWNFQKVKVPWFPLVMVRDRDLDCRVNEHVWKRDNPTLTIMHKTWSYFILHGSRFFAEGCQKMTHLPDRHFPGVLNAVRLFVHDHSEKDGENFERAAVRCLEVLGIPIRGSLGAKP